MVKVTSFVKNYQNGIAKHPFLRFIWFELISIIKHKLEILDYKKIKLVSYESFRYKSSS